MLYLISPEEVPLFHQDGATLEVTRAECAELFSERLAALRDAVERDTLLTEAGPRGRTGYKAFLRLHERARDGSILATVLIERPAKHRRYRRSLRIVTGESRGAERPVHLRVAGR